MYSLFALSSGNESSLTNVGSEGIWAYSSNNVAVATAAAVVSAAVVVAAVVAAVVPSVDTEPHPATIDTSTAFLK